MKLKRFAAFAAAFMLGISSAVLPAYADEEAPAETAQTAEAPAAAEKHPEGISISDGKTVCYDKNGEMLKGQWYTDSEGNKSYFRKNGERAENISLMLDGRLFRFDEKGAAVYSDPTPESGVTTFSPFPIGTRFSDIYGSDGIVFWERGKARTDAYAYNAYTFIKGRKCPLTFEFDKHNCLTAWYIDIPATEEEQYNMLNWMIALWGVDCDIDEDNRVAYWYYTDDGSGEKRGIAAAFSDDMLSVSTIIF